MSPTNPSSFPISLRGRSAFTLIELLVVIAIIAILAAILFPVFAQAREKARQATCMSNFKEIGLAMMMYVQDYDECYPGSYVSTSGGGSFTSAYDWTWEIFPYLKNGANNGVTEWSHTILGYKGGVFSCPSAINPDQAQQFEVRLDVFPTWYANPGDAISYAANNASGPAISMAQIPDPANKIGIYEAGSSGLATNPEKPFVVSDTWNWFSWWSYSTDPNDLFLGATMDCDNPKGGAGDSGAHACNIMPRYRHNGTADMLFLDGHVKAMHKGNWFLANWFIPGLCEKYWDGNVCSATP